MLPVIPALVHLVAISSEIMKLVQTIVSSYQAAVSHFPNSPLRWDDASGDHLRQRELFIRLLVCSHL
jgi:hypothetical protein